MLQKFHSCNNLDPEGNPAGGHVVLDIPAHPEGLNHAALPALFIRWQDGPLGRGEDRKEPNGAFVETVLKAALQRIEHYQGTKFSCRENALAITKIEEALMWLNRRTQRREEENVEGTHAGN